MKGSIGKSTEQKKAQGTHRPGRDNPTEPDFAGLTEVPPIPGELVGNVRGSYCWNQTAEILAGAGVLTEGDLSALSVYCLAYANYWRAAERIDDEGDVIEYRTQFGTRYMRHPAYTTLEKAETQIERMLTHFGLTPATRHKVSAVAKSEDDALQKLFKQAHGAN